jgi:hypothetical protein
MCLMKDVVNEVRDPNKECEQKRNDQSECLLTSGIQIRPELRAGWKRQTEERASLTILSR